MAETEVDMTVTQHALDAEGPSTSSSPPAITSPKRAPGNAIAQEVAAAKAAKKGKAQDPSTEFVSVLSTRIEEIERAVAAGHGSPAEREAAKARKKALREVVKFCSDRTNSSEDRITFVQNKYALMLSELLRLERTTLELQKDNEALTKERDKAQSELKRTNLLKDKLEELCRQLQREAREVADESRRRNEEELRQRQALQAKFTQAINEVTEKMDAQAGERSRQLAENEELRSKLDSFLGQFESFNALVQKKDAELSLAYARAEQATELAAQLQAKAELLQQANEKYLAAIEELKPELQELDGLRSRNALLTQAKDELQAQLEHYGEKFAEFQDTLCKSNETFASLRDQMEAGAKARSSLARDRDEARKRAERSDQTIVQLLEDRQALKKQVELLQAKLNAGGDAEGAEEVRRLRAQKETLEGLCRALQQQLRQAKAQQQQQEAAAAAQQQEGGGGGGLRGEVQEEGAGGTASGDAGQLANGHGPVADQAQAGEAAGGSGAAVDGADAAADNGAPDGTPDGTALQQQQQQSEAVAEQDEQLQLAEMGSDGLGLPTDLY